MRIDITLKDKTLNVHAREYIAIMFNRLINHKDVAAIDFIGNSDLTLIDDAFDALKHHLSFVKPNIATMAQYVIAKGWNNGLTREDIEHYIEKEWTETYELLTSDDTIQRCKDENMYIATRDRFSPVDSKAFTSWIGLVTQEPTYRPGDVSINILESKTEKE